MKQASYVDEANFVRQRNYMRASGQIYEEFCLTSCPKHIVFMEELKENTSA